MEPGQAGAWSSAKPETVFYLHMGSPPVRTIEVRYNASRAFKSMLGDINYTALKTLSTSSQDGKELELVLSVTN